MPEESILGARSVTGAWVNRRCRKDSRCLIGQVLLSFVWRARPLSRRSTTSFDAWHADDAGGALHEYLGMTEEEYSLWLRAPDALPCILKARRDREPLTRAIGKAYETMRLAPSGNDAPTVARLRRSPREKGVLA